MAEYIDRETAKLAVKHIPWCDWKAVGDCLDSIPAADVEVVKHGRWVQQRITSVDSIEISRCSLCDYPVSTMWRRTSYCPNCGAKMDLEVTNGLDQH